MEDFTDAHYAHAERVCKHFEIKNIGKYHNLHVQSNTLLLADVFEHFRNICIEIYKLDPGHFLSSPGLTWQTAFKKTKVKLDFLTDIKLLLMVEKGIREGIWIEDTSQINEDFIKTIINKVIKDIFLKFSVS